MIVVVAFVDTSAAVLYRSGSSGAMKAVVPQPQLADASSVTMARMSIVRLVAPPVGGALFDLSRGLPFLVDAVSYAFSTAALLLMRTPFQEERVPGARTPFREGLAYFWSIPFLRTTIGMIAASNLVAVGAPIALIILAHRQGLSGFAIGVFVAIQGVSAARWVRRCPRCCGGIFPMRAILLSEFWMALVYVAFLVYPNVYVLAALHRAARVLVPEHRLGDPGVLVHAHPGSSARTGDGRLEHAARRVGAARPAPRRTPARARPRRRSRSSCSPRRSSSPRCSGRSARRSAICLALTRCRVAGTAVTTQPRSFSRRSWLTTFGSALPCVSRITWPTKKPSTPSLPPR